MRKAGELLNQFSIHAAKYFPPLAGAVRDTVEAVALPHLKGAVALSICNESARLVSTSLLVQTLCSELMQELKGVQLGAVYGTKERMILNG